MNKFIKNSLKIITVFFILIILIIYYFGRYSLGAENNLDTSQGDETTQHYLNLFGDEENKDAIAQQQEILDIYNAQKKLKDENKELHKTLEKQAEELEEKEILERMLLKQRSKKEEEMLCSKEYLQYDDQCDHRHRDYSTAQKAKEVGQQVVKETNRIENQVKGILKKFN